jgi:microsomal prostaglandin-E synthase 2
VVTFVPFELSWHNVMGFEQSTAAVGGEGAREEQRSGFSSQLAPFALAGVAVAAVAAPLAAAEASAASTAPVVWGELGEVVMYSYAVCPFCNKVRAFLDLHKGAPPPALTGPSSR